MRLLITILVIIVLVITIIWANYFPQWQFRWELLRHTALIIVITCAFGVIPLFFSYRYNQRSITITLTIVCLLLTLVTSFLSLMKPLDADSEPIDIAVLQTNSNKEKDLRQIDNLKNMFRYNDTAVYENRGIVRRLVWHSQKVYVKSLVK